MSFETVRMVIMDVDGVLTDGKIVVDDQGVETKQFHVHDGTGIKYLLRAGLSAAWISGRSSETVSLQARELGLDDVYQGAKVKREAYEQILAKHDLTDAEVCYIGDDLTDLPVLRSVGLPVAVANARDEVKGSASYVTRARGGEGAVREVIERILKAQNRWRDIMSRYT